MPVIPGMQSDYKKVQNKKKLSTRFFHAVFLTKNISKVNFYCKYHLLSTKNFTEKKNCFIVYELKRRTKEHLFPILENLGGKFNVVTYNFPSFKPLFDPMLYWEPLLALGSFV